MSIDPVISDIIYPSKLLPKLLAKNTHLYVRYYYVYIKIYFYQQAPSIYLSLVKITIRTETTNSPNMKTENRSVPRMQYESDRKQCTTHTRNKNSGGWCSAVQREGMQLRHGHGA